MKKETVFLKLALVLISIPILAIIIFGFPSIIMEAGQGSGKMAYVLYGMLMVMSLSAIPFFTALYQAYKLLCYIDENRAFSDLSVKSLSLIKKCAGIISLIYTLGLPLFYIVGEVDDAPGVIVIGMILIFAPMVIAVFTGVLQKLLKNAIDIKNDNDLTI